MNTDAPMPLSSSAIDGNWYGLTETERDTVLAHLADEHVPALVVALHEQRMGEPLDISYDVYRVQNTATLQDIFWNGSEYSSRNFPGPRSTEFEFDAEYVLAHPGEEVYGDSDFDSSNNAAFEVYYTYYPA